MGVVSALAGQAIKNHVIKNRSRFSVWLRDQAQKIL